VFVGNTTLAYFSSANTADESVHHYLGA